MSTIKSYKHGSILYNPNDEIVGASLTNYGEYEEPIVKFFESIVKNGDWIVDVGSGIGTNIPKLSKIIGNSGVIWAFEPQKMLYYMLCGNIAINNLNNVVAFQKVISNRIGKMRIPEQDFNTLNNFGDLELNKVYSNKFAHTTAQITTIDEIKLDRCNLIRLDISGLEIEVLEGAIKTIEKFQPIIYIAHNDVLKTREIVKFLEKLNYSVFAHKFRLFQDGNSQNNHHNIFAEAEKINLVCVYGHKKDTYNNFPSIYSMEYQDTMGSLNRKTIGSLLAYAQKYAENNQYEKSKSCLNLALHINDKEVIIYQNLASLFSKQLRFKDAIKCLEEAIHLQPNNFPLYKSKGLMLSCCGKHKEAIKEYKNYLLGFETDPHGHFNMSLDMLATGDFKEGFREYEWRLYSGKSAAYIEKFGDAPFWNGEPNKRVLCFIEQGAGDFFQFIRYAKLLKDRGCTVISEMWEDTKDLQYENIDETVIVKKYISDDVKYPEYDCIMSWCSAPYIFETTPKTIPNKFPYITTNRICSGINGGIGVIWAGSENHENDHTRSMFLKDMKPLENLGIPLYSLQLGNMERTWDTLGKINLLQNADIKAVDLSNIIKTFNDTASIINSLSCIVTVDTSVAHLAGAMGKRVYLALSKICDWRWGIKNNKSKWYPSIKIYRQKELNNWEHVMQKIATDIQLDDIYP